MSFQQLNEYVIREEVMKLLSAQELDEINNQEQVVRLREGQEYLDLEQTRQGVKRATQGSPPLGRVLSRDAVHAATWSQIVALVSGASNDGPQEAPLQLPT